MEYIGDIVYDTALIKEETDLIIFGAGRSGGRTAEFLRINGCGHKIRYFCDSSSALWGRKKGEITIISPQKAVQYKNVCFLVSGRYAGEIVAYLSQNNIRKIHLLLV